MGESLPDSEPAVVPSNPKASSQCDFIMFWRRVVSDILQGIKNLNFCSTEQQTNKIHYIWVIWEDQA